jgi:hypothetical protein
MIFFRADLVLAVANRADVGKDRQLCTAAPSNHDGSTEQVTGWRSDCRCSRHVGLITCLHKTSQRSSRRPHYLAAQVPIFGRESLW